MQTKKFIDITKNIVINFRRYPRQKVPALSIWGLVFLANLSFMWVKPTEMKENINVRMTPKAKPPPEVECQLSYKNVTHQ